MPVRSEGIQFLVALDCWHDPCKMFVLGTLGQQVKGYRGRNAERRIECLLQS